MHKYRLNDVKSEYVTRVWADRSDEERDAIADKISRSQKEHMAGLTADERRAVTEKARSFIDVSVQAPAASRGLKKWWRELKKDPERYAAYMSKREESRRRTIAARKEMT